MSNQNPIHRDRGKRDQGDQPYQDAREALSQNEAEMARGSDIPGDQGDGLDDEQRDELFRQAASERLSKVQEKMDDESTS